MKHRLLVSLFTGIICTLLAWPALAQEDELKDLPGYVDFGDLSAAYGEPKISINIGGTLLQFVGTMSEDSNPETAKMLSKLKGVRVFGYDTGDDTTAAKKKFATVKANLKSRGWEPVVQVNQDDEQVFIYMKTEGKTMDGMTVMTVDDEEVMFINIIGQLDPKELGKVMQGLNVDVDGALKLK
ncbi:MAG: DUF4252 domain-containing protein [Lysobacterales bacterium]|jgi:hypothetical protein